MNPRTSRYGASVGPGRDVATTIKREMKEETDLVIESSVPFDLSSSPDLERITFPNGDKLNAFNLLFFVDQFSGKMKISGEPTNLDWFDALNLPPILKNMERTVLAYQDYVRTKVFQIV